MLTARNVLPERDRDMDPELQVPACLGCYAFATQCPELTHGLPLPGARCSTEHTSGAVAVGQVKPLSSNPVCLRTPHTASNPA